MASKGIITRGIISGGSKIDLAPAVAPAITASGSLSGRDYIITVDSLTGAPAPSTRLALTLDNVDVSGDVNGSGPWSYTVPDSASAQDLAWTVTATNSGGRDAASGAASIPASHRPPAALTAPGIYGTPEPGATITIIEGTYSGEPAPTITGTLTLGGVDVSADMAGADYTIPGSAAGLDIIWSEVASNGTAPDATQSVADTVVASMVSDWVIAADSIDNWPDVPVPSYEISYATIFEEAA